MAPTPKPKSATGRKRAPARRAPKKAAARSRGIEPEACRLDAASAEVAALTHRIEHEGGVVLGAYHEPLGGHPVVFASLPIDKIEPTPFQRDLSEAHHKKLAGVLDKTGLFLDPVIAITAPKEGFWTPNGRHRLAAMRRLGARAITALVVPRREIAWQILALNTEKAHNLKERSLEVIRIYRGLLEEDGARAETEFAYYLEEAALVTLGLCYEQKKNFAGGAYAPILRRLETFSGDSLRKALHDLGFVKNPSKLDAERLMEHTQAVSGWFLEDREIEISAKRVMKIIESTNDPRSEYYDLMRRESVPAEELMGRRMEIGVVAVLGQLRAKRNWHRIMREWIYADPPATELGEQEWEYFEGRGVLQTPIVERSLEGEHR